MKIAIFVSYTYPFIGSGIGNVALKQAETLAKAGHTVTLISSNIPETKKRFKKNGVSFIKINALNFLYKLAVPVPLFLFDKETLASVKKVDVIHIHDILYPSSILATYYAKKYHKPVILTQHIPFIVYKNPLFNLLQRIVFHTFGKYVLNTCSQIIYFNSEVGEWLQTYKDKLVYLPNGVDTAFFYPVARKDKLALKKKYRLPQNLPVVLFVGRMVPKKGYDLVMNAADEDYFILMAGGGEVKNPVSHHHLKMLGQQSPEKLRELYQVSDIFLLPSHSEGYPLSVQEAMASGLAIIVSDLQCYKDFGLDRKLVTLIKPSTANIKKALRKLVKYPEIVGKMKSYSRRTAVKTYSWKTNSKELEKLYKEVV
jgi:glycosyltransferase involved in cell wall biosynthesis